MTCPIITVYDHPLDIPKFVARLFDVDKPTNVFMTSDDLESLVEKLPWYMTFIPPYKTDHENVVGVWL